MVANKQAESDGVALGEAEEDAESQLQQWPRSLFLFLYIYISS